VRKYEERPIRRPATTRRVLTALTCDRCGEACPDLADEQWADEPWEIDEIEIERRHGYNYPDSQGEEVDKEVVDLCPGCWKEMLAWVAAGVAHTHVWIRYDDHAGVEECAGCDETRKV